MKNALLLALLLLVPTAQGAEPAKPAAIPFRGQPAEEMVKAFYAARKFPFMVDQYTRADSVQGKGDTLSYNFTVTAPQDAAARKRLSAQQNSNVEAMACGAPAIRRMLEDGYTLWFNYDFGNPDANLKVRLLPRRCP